MVNANHFDTRAKSKRESVAARVGLWKSGEGRKRDALGKNSETYDWNGPKSYNFTARDAWKSSAAK